MAPTPTRTISENITDIEVFAMVTTPFHQRRTGNSGRLSGNARHYNPNCARRIEWWIVGDKPAFTRKLRELLRRGAANVMCLHPFLFFSGFTLNPTGVPYI